MSSRRGAVDDGKQAACQEPSEELAAWLKEVGHRVVRRRARTNDELARDHLRQREREAAGRQLKYRRLKQVLLASIFTVSFLQYYFVDVMLQIVSLRGLTVFTGH